MASARRSVQDFMAQVNAQTPGVKTSAVYSTALNSDGSVAISVNGVIVWSKVQWATGSGGAVTDSNISGDMVTIVHPDASISRGDAQLFINSLT